MKRTNTSLLGKDLKSLKKRVKEAIDAGEIKHPLRSLQVLSIFPQSWTSSACEFEGLGLRAFTTAFTIVMQDHDLKNFYVFIDGKFAYRVSGQNKIFIKDLNSRQVAGKVQAMGKYSDGEPK